MKNFKGKTVYVVGGSSGIGLAAACRWAGKGADVILFARGQSGLDDAVQRVSENKASPRQTVAACAMDVSDGAAVAEILAAAMDRHGVPQVLINSAGRSRPHRFADLSAGQFDETMKVNLYGVWNTVAGVTPRMIAAGEGYIVNVSSLAGFIGVYGFTDYCASKFAVIGFSEALRSELKPHGITVSVLCPPDTDTPGFHEENKTKPLETRELSANARLLRPEAVADALLEGMSKNRFMIIPGLDGKILYRIKRFLPRTADWIVDMQIRKIRRKAGRG